MNRRPVSSLAALVIGAAWIAAYFAWDSIAWRDLTYTLMPLAALAVIVARLRSGVIADRRPWFVLALSLGLYSLGNGAYAYYELVLHEISPFPFVGDAFFLASEALQGAFFLMLAARRGKARLGTLGDSVIVTLPIGMILWVELLAPVLHDPGLSAFARVTGVGYPVMYCLVAAGVVAFSLWRSLDRGWERLISIAGWIFLPGTFGYGLLVLSGDYFTGHPVDALFHAHLVLSTAAVLHPSISDGAAVAQERSATSRALIFIPALIVAAVAVMTVSEHRLDQVVMFGAAVVLIVALTRRYVTLYERAEDQVEQLEHNRAELDRLAGRYQFLLENSPAVVYVSSLDGPTPPYYVSPRWEELTGFPLSAFEGDPDLGFTLMHPEDRPAAEAAWERAIQTGDPYQADYRLRRADGTYVWVRDAAIVLRDYRDGRDAVQGVILDISVQKSAEVELMRSRERFRSLIDHATDAIFLHTPEGKIVEVNAEACRTLGYDPEELRATELAALLPPSEWERIRALIEATPTGTPSNVETELVAKDGSAVPVEIRLGRFELEGTDTMISVARDISERLRAQRSAEILEHQLVQSQKLEAIGQLAGGVAHDFNNLLAVILNFTEFVLDELPDEDQLRHDLQEVIHAAHRGSSLVSQLLTFSRREVVRPEVVDVNEIVSDQARLLRRTLGEHIRITTSLASGLRAVWIDPAQLHQIVMNLCVNARDAMPGGGSIYIETVNEGDDVVLTVTDTGQGMSEAVRERIFEPFFTTKERGAGTGLGLSTVYGIVQRAGGTIAVDSTPGIGTSFRVSLPASSGSREAGEARGSTRSTGTGGGKLLVVEDERAVRLLVKRILERAGHEVVAAADPAEALRMLDEVTELDLLLTDLVMPGMSGSRLAEMAQERVPGLTVLFMSGYSEEMLQRQGFAGSDTGEILRKPFGPEDLVRAVGRALAAGRTRQANPSR